MTWLPQLSRTVSPATAGTVTPATPLVGNCTRTMVPLKVSDL